MRRYESRARATLEALICGDNAEIGLRALADGRFAEFVWWRVGVGALVPQVSTLSPMDQNPHCYSFQSFHQPLNRSDDSSEYRTVC
jgi:hypothetical protein